MTELVMVVSKDQSRAEKAFKKLGVEKPVLWKDYCAEILDQAGWHEDSATANIEAAKILKNALKQQAQALAPPAGILVVAETSISLKNRLKVQVMEGQPLPEVIHFLTKATWVDREHFGIEEGFVADHEKTTYAGITLGEYLEKFPTAFELPLEEHPKMVDREVTEAQWVGSMREIPEDPIRSEQILKWIREDYQRTQNSKRWTDVITRDNVDNKEALFKALQDVPDGQDIHYQIVSADGQVQNVGADFLICPYADFSVIQLSHLRLDTDDNGDRSSDQRYIVSAANRVWDNDGKTTRIVMGCRHFDILMQSQFDVLIREGHCDESSVRDSEQGFVDNQGYFHDRIEAMVIAKAAGQIRNPNISNGDFIGDELFSEHLY